VARVSDCKFQHNLLTLFLSRRQVAGRASGLCFLPDRLPCFSLRRRVGQEGTGHVDARRTTPEPLPPHP
jgi:hypothetical protein